MAPISAFIARSFDPADEERIRPILQFLETFKDVGFFCESASRAEVESVSKKVRDMIDERQAFIGFFTRRYPAYPRTSRMRSAFQIIFGNNEPTVWSAPAWVLQESGYALRGGKDLILLKEPGVEVFGLQGDLEYVTFDPTNPAAVYPKLNEMIHRLLAKAAGTEVRLTISERKDEAKVAIESPPAEVSRASTENETGERDNLQLFFNMSEAAKKRNFAAIHEAWVVGTSLIVEGKDKWVDKLTWDCAYHQFRFEAGASDGLEELRRLRAENSDNAEPILAIARCLRESGEFEEAAELFLAASVLQEGEDKARCLVSSAKAYLETKNYAAGEAVIDEAIPLATGELREEAIRSRYLILKGSGNHYLAFAIAEYALHENPQFSIRFSLGLDYHRNDLNELALLHFKFLHDRNEEDSSTLHNLALMYSDCKLPIASVKHYKTAFAMGETLSAANLGFMYLDCGMAQEANAIADKAMEAGDHVPRVEKCLAEIVRRQEEEEHKESTILDEAGHSRIVLVSMGRSLATTLPAVDGRWKFPFGEMPLAVISGELHGASDVTAEVPLIGADLFGMGGTKTFKTNRYTLNGKLRGALCQFDMVIKDTTDYGSLVGTLLSGSKTKSGFILFNSEGKSATYVELSDGKLGEAEIIFKTS